MIEIPEYLLGNKKPFLVCSRAVLKQQVDAIKSLGTEVFYSVKTNPEERILGELKGLDVGFSVSTPDEFLTVMSVGVNPADVIYYERGLSKERVEWVVQNGCRSFVVDSKRAFENLAPHLDSEFSVLIRLTSEAVPSKYSGSYLPGLNLEDAKGLAAACKKSGAKIGFLHHSASQMVDPAYWRKKFDIMSGLPEADVLDIGGGMPIGYHGEHYTKVFDEIKQGLRKLKAGRIIAEPGRFIVGPACSLVTRAELIDGGNVVLNASVYNVHIDTIIAELTLPCRALKGGVASKKFKLLGSSLCNLDIFDDCAKLPALAEGDVLVFDNAGAYNLSSDFSPGSRISTYIIP